MAGNSAKNSQRIAQFLAVRSKNPQRVLGLRIRVLLWDFRTSEIDKIKDQFLAVGFKNPLRLQGLRISFLPWD